MELLTEYDLISCCINGLDTYIISPIQYEMFVKDETLLKKLNLFCIKREIVDLIQITEKFCTNLLFFALVRHPNRIEKYKYEPVLCYKKKEGFYHIAYRDSWMCRECNNILYTSLIMPKSEEDPIFYCGTESQYPNIPSFFQKLPCPKCGKLLQNHLMSIHHLRKNLIWGKI